MLKNNNNNNNLLSPPLDSGQFELSTNINTNTNTKTNTNARFIKYRIKSLYIDPSDISFDSFSRLVLSNLKVNVGYSVLYKVKYNDTDFGMIGYQEGITLSSIHDNESIQIAWDNLTRGIREFSDEYSAESIDLIQMLYVVIDDIPELKLKKY